MIKMDGMEETPEFTQLRFHVHLVAKLYQSSTQCSDEIGYELVERIIRMDKNWIVTHWSVMERLAKVSTVQTLDSFFQYYGLMITPKIDDIPSDDSESEIVGMYTRLVPVEWSVEHLRSSLNWQWAEFRQYMDGMSWAES